MPAIEVKIIGLRKLESGLRKFDDRLIRKLDRAINKSIFDLEAKTKPVTPIDTGKLRSAFTREFRTMRGELHNITPYATFVHEGTRRWPINVPPRNAGTVRRFFVKGLELAERKINMNFKKAVDKVVKLTSRG